VAHFKKKLFQNFSEGLKETKKNVGQNIQSHGRKSNHRSLEYKAGKPTTTQRL
jgi:hypothetical protein